MESTPNRIRKILIPGALFFFAAITVSIHSMEAVILLSPRGHDSREDPARHATLGEAPLEQEHEARPDEKQQQRVPVGPVGEPPDRRGGLVFGEGHRVDLAGPAPVEVAGVRVVEAVLSLPPPAAAGAAAA